MIESRHRISVPDGDIIHLRVMEPKTYPAGEGWVPVENGIDLPGNGPYSHTHTPVHSTSLAIRLKEFANVEIFRMFQFVLCLRFCSANCLLARLKSLCSHSTHTHRYLFKKAVEELSYVNVVFWSFLFFSSLFGVVSIAYIYDRIDFLSECWLFTFCLCWHFLHRAQHYVALA